MIRAENYQKYRQLDTWTIHTTFYNMVSYWDLRMIRILTNGDVNGIQNISDSMVSKKLDRYQSVWRDTWWKENERGIRDTDKNWSSAKGTDILVNCWITVGNRNVYSRTNGILINWLGKRKRHFWEDKSSEKHITCLTV